MDKAKAMAIAEVCHKMTTYLDGISELIEELNELGVNVSLLTELTESGFATHTGVHIMTLEGKAIPAIADAVDASYEEFDRGYSPITGQHYGIERLMRMGNTKFYELEFPKEDSNGRD